MPSLTIREGRVWLGGDVVAAGYLGNAALTEASFSEEEDDGEMVRWYESGDLGELDGEGRLRVLGRVDDVIITGGLKVSAGTVTDGLHRIQGVREAFVLPVPSQEWGQQVAAMVVGSCTAAELLAAASDLMEPHLVPKTVVFVSEFPLLPNGKPDRTAILAALTEAARAA